MDIFKKFFGGIDIVGLVFDILRIIGVGYKWD